MSVMFIVLDCMYVKFLLQDLTVSMHTFFNFYYLFIVGVLDPSKGVCADPVGRVAILEVKGPGPPGGVSERQLSPDRGGEKT